MALRTPAFNDAKTYGFEWVRAALIETICYEGVLNFGGAGTDLKVTAAAGGGLKVDVAAGACLIKGDSGVPATGLSQGLFFAINDASIPNAVTLTAAHATLPRIDQIVLRVRDSADLGTGADDLTIMAIAGVATSGATLDNRSGAAALPNDCIRLADILIPAAAVAVTAGNVRDRRKKGRPGFLGYAQITSSYAGVTTTTADITGLTITPLEYDGDVTVEARTFNFFSSTLNTFGQVGIRDEANAIVAAGQVNIGAGPAPGGVQGAPTAPTQHRPAPGLAPGAATPKTFKAYASVGSGTGTLDAAATNPIFIRAYGH